MKKQRAQTIRDKICHARLIEMKSHFASVIAPWKLHGTAISTHAFVLMRLGAAAHQPH